MTKRKEIEIKIQKKFFDRSRFLRIVKTTKKRITIETSKKILH